MLHAFLVIGNQLLKCRKQRSQHGWWILCDKPQDVNSDAFYFTIVQIFHNWALDGMVAFCKRSALFRAENSLTDFE